MRNRDLRPAAKANPTIQQAFERFQKYNRLKNLSQGSLDFYAAKGRSFFRFLGDTEQPIHTITEETVEDYIFYMLKSGENNNQAANPPGYLLSDIKRRSLSSLLDRIPSKKEPCYSC